MSPPMRGRGLKHGGGPQPRGMARSPPMRGRGLKLGTRVLDKISFRRPLHGGMNGLYCCFGQKFGVTDKPDPDVCIQQYHFNDSQSLSPTGSVGFSYLMTEFLSILRASEGFSE